jgi:S-adenosylmethionine synthetase
MVEGTLPGHIYFASESVGEGHPDKLCDQISDSIVDACFEQDPNSWVAMETATKTNMICLLGEVTTKAKVDYEAIARKVACEVGYTADDIGLDGAKCQVIVNVHSQSPEIAGAVHIDKKDEDTGAGDQGLMFGYATDEWDTETLHPYSHYLSNLICEKMHDARHSGAIPWLRPDCKSQVIVEYKKEADGQLKPTRVYNVLISTQHAAGVSNEEIRNTLIKEIIEKNIPAEMLKDTKYVINPSGSFTRGGPSEDAGLTGRKIIVDTYGGWAPHGGGAFSGKDPSKVDRSAAYYGRYVAKSIVANKLAHRCQVQVSYAIGLAEPLSIHVETFGTGAEGRTDEDIAKIIRNNFSFRPGNIIKELNLRRPIYRKTSKYGHFGRRDPDFTWETPKLGLKLD